MARNLATLNRNSFTVSKLIDDFLIYQQYKNNAPATLRYYKDNLTMFNKYLESCGISTIDDVDINVLRQYVLY